MQPSNMHIIYEQYPKEVTGTSCGTLQDTEFDIDNSDAFLTDKRYRRLLIEKESSEFNDRQRAETLRIQHILNNVRDLNIKTVNSEDVRNYLLRFPDLITICSEICALVVEEFSNNYKLSLEVFLDSEIDYRHLSLYVRQDEYDENIMDRIRAVRKEIRNMLKGIKGDLHLTTDFQPPK